MIIFLLNRIGNAVYLLKWIKNHVQDKAVEANPQQENNFVFLSPFHSIFVIYTPSMLSERISVSSCCEKEIRDFKNWERVGLENVRTESGAGASTAF